MLALECVATKIDVECVSLTFCTGKVDKILSPRLTTPAARHDTSSQTKRRSWYLELVRETKESDFFDLEKTNLFS